MINVNKPFLPDIEVFIDLVKDVWQRNWLTNRGPLATRLEQELKDYLDLDHLLFVHNGTIAIQVAIKAMELKGEIITTPFSYVATTTSILWENCEPVFVDIGPETFCIDANLIEAAITERTSAILATHVYGFPCDTAAIERIAQKHNLRVIYDAAHAFGVKYKGKSLLSYGDIATCSFHATKVFHTGEGGAIVCNDELLREKVFNLHAFGHRGDEYFDIGINAKNSELHAAMGLCNIQQIDRIIASRRTTCELYRSLLDETHLTIPAIPDDTEHNYSYFPVLFKNEQMMLKVKQALEDAQVNTRRYFYPSLNTLPYLKHHTPCPVSEDAALRVLCLPLYYDLKAEDVKRICRVVNETI